MKPDRICHHLERVNPRFRNPEFTLTPVMLRRLVELVYKEAQKDLRRSEQWTRAPFHLREQDIEPDFPDVFKDLFGGTF